MSLTHTCDAVGLQLVEANSLKEFPGRGQHHDRTPAAALGDLLPTTNPGTNLLWFIGDAGVSAWRTKTSNSSVCNHLIGEGCKSCMCYYFLLEGGRGPDVRFRRSGSETALGRLYGLRKPISETPISCRGANAGHSEEVREGKRMRLRLYSPASLALAVLVFVAPPAFAQATISFAQLNGTVEDTSGRPIAKAQVTLREVDTNRTYTATTNDAGFYVVPTLTPGRYELEVQYSGFAKFTQTGIVLTVGQTATIDVTLKIASVGETVLVTGEAPPVEPT